MHTDNGVRLYQTNGKLKYYDSGWVVLEIDPSIAEYYRYVIKKYYFYNRLNKPKHPSHITVIAGKYENVIHHPLWRKYDELVIQIEYNSFVKYQELYFWLEVDSPFLKKLRNELGLSDIPKWQYHITVGNLKNLI